MGRTGAGVEVREKSIRFTFVPGKPTLMVDGKPVLPTPANATTRGCSHERGRLDLARDRCRCPDRVRDLCFVGLE